MQLRTKTTATLGWILVGSLSVSGLQNEQDSQLRNRMATEDPDAIRNKLQDELHKNSVLKKKLSLYEPKSQTRTQRVLISGLADSYAEVQDEIADLLIQTYTSAPSDSPPFDTLDSALQAVEFKVMDGEPIQVKGYPFLYVGSVGASLNKEDLVENNITHIVNWSGTARCNVFDDIEYKCVFGIHGADMASPDNVEQLSDAVEFMENARKSGGSVMSHCWYGRNRSVTALVAYLMKYAGMSIDDATDLVAVTRPQADPYIEALESYEAQYLNTDVKV